MQPLGDESLQVLYSTSCPHEAEWVRLTSASGLFLGFMGSGFVLELHMQSEISFLRLGWCAQMHSCSGIQAREASVFVGG